MYNAALRLLVYHGAQRMGTVESADSLQWMPCFDDVGEVKLVCAATPQNRALLRTDARLYNLDTPGIAAIIVSVQLASDTLQMTVRGRFGLDLLSRRVCMGKHAITDAAAGLLQLCRDNLRGLPVSIPQAAGFTAACQEAVDWRDCGSAAVQLAQAGGFGVRVAFDPVTGSESLQLAQGVDRTTPGTENYRGYFSTRMQNLSAVTYTTSTDDYANVVICGGEEPSEGDSFSRYICTVGAVDAAGAARRELWVDGSSVRHKYTEQVNGASVEKSYTEPEYQQALQHYALAALVAHLGSRELKCTAADSPMIFGSDYNLGDRVPVIVEEFGLRATARVARVKIIYEETGRTLCPVFDAFKIEGE